VDAAKGCVLTSNHVIRNAQQIVVTLKDRRSFEAKLVSTDPGTDIAVLKVEAKNLSALRFGDSNALQVGDYVVAIGNPSAWGRRSPRALSVRWGAVASTSKTKRTSSIACASFRRCGPSASLLVSVGTFRRVASADALRIPQRLCELSLARSEFSVREAGERSRGYFVVK
jgi:hypothetical protein